MAMGDLTQSFAFTNNASERARLCFAPTQRGVLSWNTHAQEALLRFRVLRHGSPASPWLDHVRWNARERRSCSPSADGVTVEVDTIEAAGPFDGIEVAAQGVEFALLAFATPSAAQAGASPLRAREPLILSVPQRSQYIVEGERGWCSPASLAMLHAYHGFDGNVAETARAVFDSAYDGTGNWSFNVAYSGSLGLRGVVAYLRDLDHAARLLERNLPIAISYSWNEGDLPGAPLPRSDGHLAVLRGFTAQGDCAMNDPAVHEVATVYPRAAIERCWRRSGGIAYVVAPIGIPFADVLQT